MTKTSLTVLAAVLLLGSLNASAQEELVARDVLEISLYGGLAIPSGGITDFTTGQGMPLQDAGADTLFERGAETGWNIGVDIGFYFTPRLIGGFMFRYTEFGIDSDLAGDHVHRLYNPSIYAKYSFEGESYWVPYIKGWFGLENPKFSTAVLNRGADPGEQRIFRELSYDPALAFGAALGLFYYTAEYSGVFVQAGYHHALTEDVKGTYVGQDDYIFGENTGVLSINAGVKLIIGSGD